MTLQKGLAVLLAVLLLLGLTACADKAEDGAESLTVEEYLPEIVPPLNLSITDCLSEAQVSEIIGVDMVASDAYEHGTWVIYSSEDGRRQVSVSMENTTAELYATLIQSLPEAQAFSELGDNAYWNAPTSELIYYIEGYQIAVKVTDSTVYNTKGLCLAIVKVIETKLQEK